MKFFLALALCVLAASAAGAQSLSLFGVDAANFPTMKAKFYAFDAAGNRARPTATELTMTENGTPRSITGVSCPQTKSTLSVCVMVDTKYHIGLARTGTERLVNFLDMPQDELGITMMDNGVQIHRDFTADRAKALAAAGTIPGAPGVDVQAMFYAPITGGVPFITGRKTDKKVLILVTDLHCPILNLNEQQLYDDAAKENISVFSILLHANDYSGLFRRIASRTGGKCFNNVATEADITNIFQEIERTEHYEPCEITWQSAAVCLVKNISAKLSWNGSASVANYAIPSAFDVHLSLQPASVFCKNKPVGVAFDTTVTITAGNATFSITDFVSDNPVFDVIPPKQFTLAPGQSRTITVRYTPADSGYAWAKFDILNDVCSQSFYAKGGFRGKKPVAPTLKLTHPNGGETFTAGADTLITWEGIAPDDTVRLEYSHDNGATWKILTNKAAGLRYSWQNVPLPASKQCLARVSQGEGLVNSDPTDPNNAAPPMLWQKSFGGKNSDYANSVIETSDGKYYIVAGFTESPDGDVADFKGSRDGWVMKIAANDGHIVWQKNLGGSGGDEINCVIESSDGNYVVAGTTASSDGDIAESKGGGDCWIAKLSVADGSILWQKSLGGSDYDAAYSVIESSDGNYVVAGSAESNDGDIGGVWTGMSDYWIVKLAAADRRILWQKTFGGSWYDRALSVIESNDGAYVAVGLALKNDMPGAKGKNDVLMVKLAASDGDTVWMKLLGGSGDEEVNSIIRSSDGNYVIAGKSTSINGDLTQNKGNFDAWIAKIATSDGGVIWQKSLGGDESDEAASIAESSDGNYVVAGFTQSQNGDVVGNSGRGNGEYWVMKIAAGGGSIRWQKILGGGALDYALSVAACADGSYVTAGKAGSKDGDATDNKGFYDWWIVKLAADNQTILQSDASDANFSIIAPDPVVQVIDVDMGKVVVGAYSDKYVSAVVRNRGAAPLHVLGLDITSGNTTDFSIPRGAGEFFLAPNESRDITFNFTPTRTGNRSAAATLRTTVGNFSDTIIIRGIGIAPLLQVETPIVNFGKVFVGTAKDTLVTATIRNLGSIQLDVADTRHDKPNDRDFTTLSGGGSFTVLPRSTHSMQFRFAPSEEGRTTGLLSFSFNGAGSPAMLQFIGEGVLPDSGNVTLVADDASAFPGEKVNIPVSLLVPANTTLAGISGFDVTLRYNSTLLFPADNSMTVTSSGNDALLTFFAPYNPAGGELLRVPFIATLGDDTTTVVKIEKAVPRNSSGNVKVDTRNGSFALKGVCYAGGAARLYKPSGRAMLMAIHPNPAEDEAEIEYETSESGATSLKVFNALGMEVAVPASGEVNAGFHVAKVRTSDFGAGTYFVVMTTPTERHVARFEVVR